MGRRISGKSQLAHRRRMIFAGVLRDMVEAAADVERTGGDGQAYFIGWLCGREGKEVLDKAGVPVTNKTRHRLLDLVKSYGPEQMELSRRDLLRATTP